MSIANTVLRVENERCVLAVQFSSLCDFSLDVE